MPKRPCPFDYSIALQRKIRVSQKEYDLKHEDNMTKIHDKTLQKLFNGVKQLYQTNEKNLNNKAPSLTNSTELKCAAKNISEFCSLCTDLNVAENKCSFCDKWVCQLCTAICYKCCDIFCSGHSLKLYSCSDGDYVCMNCCMNDA